MIKTLKIRNVALINECKIDFENQFNILTGETGAGKSIIIDSLNFLLGAKADKGLIKSGTDFAFVEGTFEIGKNPIINSCIESLGMEYDNILLLTRQMTIDGKNECRVNGEIVSLNLYKKITAELVDVFGQHDSQVLLDSKNHLMLLDSISKTSLIEPITNLQSIRNEISIINKQINDIGGNDEKRKSEIELLEYEINEIESAGLSVEEEEDLQKKRKLIQNSEKIFQALDNGLSEVSNSNNIVNSIKSCINSLKEIENYDERIGEQLTRLNSTRYELDDVINELNTIKNDCNFSENELNKIEDRLSQIKDLKRKYGNSINDINNSLQIKKDRMVKLCNSAFELQKLTKIKNEKLISLLNSCQEITRIRKQLSLNLKTKILIELKDLGMKNADFETKFNDDYNIDNIEKLCTSIGADTIEFLFSANLGEPVKEINKIISGGEMSRFMLAFKCVVHYDDEFKTFVFDEIDTGIGGDIGTIVAKKLARISRHNQVLCVTHLAQIACFADNHLKILKFEKDNKTFTSVIPLGNDRIDEISRMIGSVETNEFAKMHARELISDSDWYKKKL